MVTITPPTTVVPGDGATFAPGFSNTTLIQGRFVYKNTTRKIVHAQANAIGTAEVVGLVLESAGAANTPIQLQTGGVVNGFAGLTTGVFYVLADDIAGAIMPVADLTAGDRITLLGYALSPTSMMLLIEPTGLAL